MSASETPEGRLGDAGYHLPELPRPRGQYALFQRVPVGSGMDWVSISGQTSRVDDGVLSGVCVPGESLEAGQGAARVAMLRVLAVLAAACGGRLPMRMHMLRLRGYVRSTPGFGEHSGVLDAASEVLGVAWPHAALPARTVVGVPSLPGGAYVEIELDALCAHL